MSFLRKLFGTGKKNGQPAEVPQPEQEAELQWIAAADNPWGIPVLDLRPFTQTVISTSTDPQMAENALSYRGEDGKVFWGKEPEQAQTVYCNIAIQTDHSLQPGVLFIPEAMEHKWAIYFDGHKLIFVRSWLREVFVVAETRQEADKLIVEEIRGTFTPGEDPELTKAILQFLLISHCTGLIVPAPLPAEMDADPEYSSRWAFSAFGNMAHIGVFDRNFTPASIKPLRSHSLLHIAVASGDVYEIEQQVKQGANVNSLAGDGLATLHWSVANDNTAILQKLLDMGADPEVRTLQGATPIMNAVQSNKINHLNILLRAGAQVNSQDNRGFTALHRAAEMGNETIVRILLDNGADKSIVAENYTALDLATMRSNHQIIQLLNQH